VLSLLPGLTSGQTLFWPDDLKVKGQKMPNWTRACATDDIEPDDMIRFDHGSQTFVIVRSEDDEFFAMNGICSHEHVHLCDGLVMDGAVECPKHSATFDYRTGEAKRAPACINLKTFPVKVDGGQVYIEI
jgi:3-phenylpropionate/trans-cinnamate dioxygenase ferredoxin subunit